MLAGRRMPGRYEATHPGHAHHRCRLRALPCRSLLRRGRCARAFMPRRLVGQRQQCRDGMHPLDGLRAWTKRLHRGLVPHGSNVCFMSERHLQRDGKRDPMRALDGVRGRIVRQLPWLIAHRSRLHGVSLGHLHERAKPIRMPARRSLCGGDARTRSGHAADARCLPGV